MKIIVTVKVKLSKTVEQSMNFHNGLFSEQNIEQFKSIGNVNHSANLSDQEDGVVLAIDTWEADQLEKVKAFYTSEDFEKNMAGEFSSEKPEINYWIQDPAWAKF